MIVTPKKFLGQHFLKDLNIAQSIADSLAITEPTNVLEIGPGMGVLTQFLLKNPQINLKVVELDRESVVYLNENFPEFDDAMIESILCGTGIKATVVPYIFKQVFNAWRKHQVIRMTYQKPDREKNQRLFEPHKLLFVKYRFVFFHTARYHS